MSRKRNPYIPLFTHDIMSSMKCRRLSMRATGLYLWLLCLMNEKPQQGRWALSTNEDHPTWKNSLTYRALQNADKYGRLPMFATLMARKFLPWKSGEVLKALQELYRFKLIVVEDDAIIQPRMYRDNGFKLREETMREYLKDDPTDPDDDPDQELADIYKKTVKTDRKKGTDKGANKSTKKGTQKVREIHAPAPAIESESENNIVNDIGNIGGVGDFSQDDTEQSPAAKTQKKPVGDTDTVTTIDGKPVVEQDDGPTFGDFWETYDKKVNMIDSEAYWSILSRSDREAIMQYLPRYKLAQPRKQFRKNPVTFLRMRAWEDEIIQDNEIRINETATRHQYHSQSQGDRDRDILEQSARIVERKLRRQEQEQSGSEAGDTE